MSTLSTARVEAITKACLVGVADKKDLPDDAVLVEAILHTYGFDAGRLEEHRAEIEEMLADLPDQFQERSGGGWSFLNACMTRDGEQWTGFHWVQEQLVALGIGIGRAKWLLPREMWEVMPGGLPYFVVTAERVSKP